ncbi:Trafficking protein particle complex subunit 4-like [Homarus americanus]|uniref:Trafficking protein particle complex subunit n=1 Tax=Homarus americanus TaxID=6706 RepID=A0A8J5N005_HOMAM|nr:Trafficking protein particle complex subunit 4-like [Homarus americanus]
MTTLMYKFHQINLYILTDKMTVHSLYILSKSGGLIYQHDHNIPTVEHEKTFSYPLEVKLEVQNRNIVVSYGQRDGIKVGHTLMAVNGMKVTGQQLEDGRDAMLASMFYPLYALACQLSPEQRSSGIEILEADNFRMNCFQTLTGVKFMVISDVKQTGIDNLLHRVYEIYSDFALKNPFYSLEMPIRCELFDEHLKSALEQAERLGISNI